MGNDDQCAGIAFEPVFQPDDRVQIQVVGRFIEQQQVGRAHQGLCQIQTHTPAAGEAGNGTFHLFQRKAKTEE